ncbi:MAG: alpha/beta fold hydrolase [SAR202 cluster bacterium]|nr:alpha/beta fold hydrolase [SAR202 cluster bacterium]
MDEFAKQYRCILYDMPNFAKTGPMIYQEGTHAVQARVGAHLLDALGIKQQVAWVGNSQGGQSSLVAAIKYQDRVKKFVMGGSHIATGGDIYFLANRPDEARYFTNLVVANPTKDNVRLYLTKHVFDEQLVTDDLVDYIHQWYTWSPELLDARAKSKSIPHDYREDLPKIKAPAFMVHGRYDRMVPFEVSITALALIPNARMLGFGDTGDWTPFEKPKEYARHVLAFLQE